MAPKKSPVVKGSGKKKPKANRQDKLVIDSTENSLEGVMITDKTLLAKLAKLEAGGYEDYIADQINQSASEIVTDEALANYHREFADSDESGGFTIARKVLFLESLRKSPTLIQACRIAGISTYTAHAHKNKDLKFAKAWEAAMTEAYERLEAKAYLRATEGTQKPIFYQGKKCGTMVEYSDRLAEFMLKGNIEKYAKTNDGVTINNGIGVSMLPRVVLDRLMGKLSDEELALFDKVMGMAEEIMKEIEKESSIA